jgi:hypothetical protein
MSSFQGWPAHQGNEKAIAARREDLASRKRELAKVQADTTISDLLKAHQVNNLNDKITKLELEIGRMTGT